MVSRRRFLIGGGAVLGTTAVAGCGALLSSGGEFQFEEVTFTDGKPAGVGTYDRQPETTYERGEDVWVYLEMGYPPTDDNGTAKLAFTFRVETPNGETWNPVEKEETWEDAEDSILLFAQGFGTDVDDDPGEYEMSITVDDRVEEQQITTTETFTLE